MIQGLSPASMGRYRDLGRVSMPTLAELAEPRLTNTLPFLIDLGPWILRSEPLALLARIVTFSLYYLPLPVLALLTGLAWRRGDRRLVGAGVAGILCFLTLFPRADVTHLLQVLPPAAVVLCMGLGPRLPRRGAMAIGVVLILAAVGLNGWRRSVYRVPLNVPRDGGLLVREDQAPVRRLIERLRENPGAPMIAMPWGSLYYFLGERENPTRWELILPGNVGPAGQEEILATLRAEPPPDLVFSTVDLRHLTPVTFEEFFPELIVFRDNHYRRILGPVAGEELWRRVDHLFRDERGPSAATEGTEPERRPPLQRGPSNPTIPPP